MKRMLLAAFLLSGCSTMGGGDGWTTLIDGGKGMENFTAVGNANWRVEDGAIVADKGQGNGNLLVSKNSYANFQLRAEFWADHTTNSGIYIHAQDPVKISSANAYEVNIYDRAPRPEFGTGSIVNVVKVAPVHKTGGQWNTYVITARGSHVQAVLNGVETATLNDAKFTSGRIALQFGAGPNDAPGGPIKWRKLQIRSL